VVDNNEKEPYNWRKQYMNLELRVIQIPRYQQEGKFYIALLAAENYLEIDMTSYDKKEIKRSDVNIKH